MMRLSRHVVRVSYNARGSALKKRLLEVEEIRPFSTQNIHNPTPDPQRDDTRNNKNTTIIHKTVKSTKSWEETSVSLINFQKWSMIHRRSAEEALQYWSRQKHKSYLVFGLWQKLLQQIPKQELSCALYDFGILALAKHDYPDEAEALYDTFINTEFTNLHDDNRHIPNSYHLNAILHAHSRKRQPRQAQALLLKAFDTKVQPNVYTLSSALDAWSRIGKGQEAQDLLDECQRRGLNVSTPCFNAVFSAWARDPQKDSFRKVQNLLQRMTTPPDPTTWSSVLKACRDPQQCEELLWKAFYDRQPINNICFNVILHKWGWQNKEKAERFLEAWLGIIGDDLPSHLLPTITTFNSILHTQAKSSNPVKAQAWFNRMKAFKVQPDSFSYNALLNAYSKVGDTPIALQLLRKMVELKFPKQQLCISYNSVISSVAKYIADNPQKANFMVDKAEQIFAEMKQNNVKPDLFTFNSLLNVYACSASMESSKRAEELIKFLENDTDLVPDIFSYSCVIDALAKSGDIQAGPRALAILHKMEVKPNVVSYNSVIAAYRNDPSRAKEAEAVLEEMIKKRINPNMTTFATLISGWSKSNSFDKAKQARRVLDLMMTKFEDLEESKKTEIVRDTCRNAHSLVVKTCSMLPDKADGAYRTEALEIATKTLEETPDPSAISYSTYFWAVSALLDNVEDRDRLITDAFRRYRSGSERVDDRVLRSLKQTISSDSYERLV